MKCLLMAFFFLSINSYAMLIAHRGVHQTYNRDGLNDQTCTATRIIKPSHNYIENTIESMEQAFSLHADMVELDVHPTTEDNGIDELAVFHDWTLDCRTDSSCDKGCKCNVQKQCITHEQSFSFLQSLDVGYGYTFDNGKTFPFRGAFQGKMPHFKDVLELLEKYPDKKVLINVKGNTDRTAKAFLRAIESYPESVRKRLYYPYKYGHKEALSNASVERGIDQSDKKCLFSYLKTGWYGHFPKECRNKRIFIPTRETLERFLGKPGRYIKVTSILWGWPKKFIKLAHDNGTEVYASQVDSIESYKKLKDLNLDGIMTNRIEIIGSEIIK